MKALWKDIISLCLYLAIIVACTYLVVHFVAQRTTVEGHSMNPALENGEQVLVDKLSYRLHEPQRFDVVAFPYRYEQNTIFVKRIIGLPGETVQIDRQGIIYINGEALSENYGNETITHPGVASTPRTLDEDEYFVLGDNRNHSHDSREADVGLLRRDEIVGRVSVILAPISRAGRVS